MLASRFALSSGLKISSSFSVLCSNAAAVVAVVVVVGDEVVDVVVGEVEFPADAVVVVVGVALVVDALIVATVLGFEFWALQVRSTKGVVDDVVDGVGNFKHMR